MSVRLGADDDGRHFGVGPDLLKVRCNRSAQLSGTLLGPRVVVVPDELNPDIWPVAIQKLDEAGCMDVRTSDKGHDYGPCNVTGGGCQAVWQSRQDSGASVGLDEVSSAQRCGRGIIDLHGDWCG